MGGTIGIRAPSRRSFDFRPLRLLLPIVVGVFLLITFVVLVDALSLVRGWDQAYGPEGRFEVESCSTESSPIASRVTCSGSLTPGEGEPVTSRLIGPQGAFGTEAPGSGAVVDAYYRRGDTSRSYPIEGRGSELARVLLAVVPLVFIVGGLSCWLLGWLLTRGTSSDDVARHPERHRWPRRFVLRPRGALWTLVGLVWFAVDRYALDDLLGSAGLG